MTIYSIFPLQFGQIETYPFASRKSKVAVADFAKPPVPKSSLKNFLDSLPNFLAANDLRALLSAIHLAKHARKPVLWGIGGHVIKTRLRPLLIDLIRRGFLSGIAMNGAALIHDFEIALCGNTSEDVEAGLGAGEFGMARETGAYLNKIASTAAYTGVGYGEAAGKFLTSRKLNPKHASATVLLAAHQPKIHVTVHLAIGTDIPHMHPAADGPNLGAATHHDFRLFCSLVKGMHTGGVYLKWGSAMLLPEVFLKAVSVVRNLGVSLL